MPGYSEDELRQARQPLRDQFERDRATCVLGHLEAEEREQPSAERAADIRAIASAVQGFDARRRTSVSASARPISAGDPTPPAPPAPFASAPPPPEQAPPSTEPRAIAGLPPQRFEVASGGIDLLSRTGAPHRGHVRIDLLAGGHTAARAAAPVDIVADMKRRHGKA